MQRGIPSKERHTHPDTWGGRGSPSSPRQDHVAAFPACAAGAKAVLEAPHCFLSDFYLPSHPRNGQLLLLRPFGNVNKESEVIKRFAAERASAGGTCYPSPGAEVESVRLPGAPGDRLSAGAGWGPGLQNNAVDKQHSSTIFFIRPRKFRGSFHPCKSLGFRCLAIWLEQFP